MKIFTTLLLFGSQLTLACVPCTAQEQGDPVVITPQVSGAHASFRGLAVRNEREAWVTGSEGTVLRTIDAGKTWIPITVPDSGKLDFRDVEVLPDGAVVLMSIGKGDASRILRSTDAGKSWTTVFVNEHPDGFFDGMAFLADGSDGLLFGDPVGGRLALFRTRDGGQSWRPLPRQHRPLLADGEYGFAASGSSIAMDKTSIWVATGGSVARVMHSSDDGLTWIANETPIRSGNESSGIFSLDVVDSQTVFVIGGDYKRPQEDQDNFAKSIDGGKSWTVAPSVRIPHKACIRSLGEGRLLTCGRTGVSYSPDAGRTWKQLTSDSYYTLAFDRGSETGFLAGSEGRVARFALTSTNRNQTE